MANQEEWWNLPAFAPFFQGQKKQGRYGYTGTGADTAIQPTRRVPGAGNGTYDAHEGEFVFDANATQAIGPDVLESIRQGAKTGQIDPNSLRQAIGQPQKPGMAVGGYTKDPYTRQLNRTVTTGPASTVLAPPMEQHTFNDPEQLNRTVTTGPASTVLAPPMDQHTFNEPEPEPDTLDDAIDYMRGLTQGNNPYMENIANRYLQDIGGAGAAAYAGAKQEMARAGMGKEAIASGLASQRRDTFSDISRAAGEMAGTSMQIASGAAEKLLAHGEWEADFGIRQANHISDMINANMPRDVVNAEFRKYTGRDMTEQEYKQMQEATSFGATTFSREKNVADLLITLGGEANLTKAAGIYGELFPGLTIDWSNVLSKERTEQFNASMTQLGNIVATAGNDVEKALLLMKASGLDSVFGEMGIDENTLKQLYQGLTINKIDEEWKAISESDAYKTLVNDDPEFAAQLKDIWARNKLGVEELTILDKYNIVDANGNILATVAGDEEAAAKAEELGGTAVKTGKKTIVMTDNETKTTYGRGVTIPPGTKQGDVWIENGIAYEFDAVAGASPTTFAEPFDRIADKLYALGETLKNGEENPYYDDIINARASAYLAGSVRLNPGDLKADDPVFQRILNDPTITRGIGSSSIDKTGRQSEEHHYFTTFQESEGAAEIAQGTLLNIDGKLYSYAGSEEQDESGDIWNAKKYYLIDMATGEIYFVRAADEELTVETPQKEVEVELETESSIISPVPLRIFFRPSPVR